MTDTRLQRLKRAWEASGSVKDEAAYLRERVRVGELSQERLELAACCGHPGAIELANVTPPEDLLDWNMRIASLDTTCGCEVLVGALELVMRDHVAEVWPVKDWARAVQGYVRSGKRAAFMASHAWARAVLVRTGSEIGLQSSRDNALLHFRNVVRCLSLGLGFDARIDELPPEAPTGLDEQRELGFNGTLLSALNLGADESELRQRSNERVLRRLGFSTVD